jgi:cyclophilin family peptidyl-prolyl cis-trans isomerase
MKPFTLALLFFVSSFLHAETAAPENTLQILQARIQALREAGELNTEAEGWRQKLPKFPEASFAAGGTYIWTLETSEGTLVAHLDYKSAPEHVRNILWLSELGFYDGLNFHRIMPGFMAQGGCPLGKGFGNPGYTLKLEAKSGRKHDVPGILSMARTQAPNSAGSQFFITFGPTPQLDGQYSVFGNVVEGLEVLKKLEAAGNPDPNSNGVPPLKDIRIVSARVAWKADLQPEP